MRSLNEYREAAAKIHDGLRLYTMPVAVKYLKIGEPIPEGFTRPSALGQKWSLCQAFTHARRWGMNVAMTGEDNFCLPSSAAHRFIDVDLPDMVQSQVLNLWHKDLDAELSIGATYYGPLMEEGNRKKLADHAAMLVAPLTKTEFVPDTVLLYGNPGQMTHVIQALGYEGRYITHSVFIGSGESCIKGALLPLLTGKPEFVNPGQGDRAFSGTTEDEVAMGLPAELLFYVAEHLFKHGGPFNLGSPIHSILPGHLDENILPGWVFLKDKIEKNKDK
jgi:uncharacterized protein (DUF169 family)